VAASPLSLKGDDVQEGASRTVVYKESIRRGSELLDERGPKNWRQKIDPSTLDLATTDCCLLGQIYGSYGRGVQKLRICCIVAVECGFATGLSYSALTRHWKDALAESA